MFTSLRRIYIADALVLSGLVLSFFQGYMRDHYGGLLSYGLVDGLFAAAFFLAILEWGPRRFFTDTPMTRPLLVLMLLGLPYIFGPDNQLLEGLLGFRAWNFYNLLFFYAYLRTEREEQVRWTIRLLVGIGVLVAAYGIYQFIQGPGQYVGGSATVMARHEYAVYYAPGGEDKIGGLIFRPYSTLNSAGALGATLAGLGLMAVHLVLDSKRNRLVGRVVQLGILGIIGICLFLTASRGALVTLVVGALALLVFQRRLAILLVVAVLAGAGLSVVNTMTEGAIFQRLESLDPTSEAAKYESYAPRLHATWGGISFLWQFGYPFGMGLGTTGVGVPTLPGIASWGFRGQAADSEIARAAIEMGYPGIILIAYFLGAIVLSASRAAIRVRRGRWRDTGAVLAALVLGYLPTTLLGSPLYGPPVSLLIWLSLGTLLKLERLTSAQEQPGAVAVAPIALRSSSLS